MKKPVLAIIVSILSLSSCYSQTYSSSVSDVAIQKFIEANRKSLGKGKLSNTIYNWDPCYFTNDPKNCLIHSFIQNKNDSIINSEILKEIQNQFTKLNLEARSFDFLKSKSPRKSNYMISVPLFADQDRFAIIVRSNSCGNECGGGGVLIFKKNENEKWEQVDYRLTWLQ